MSEHIPKDEWDRILEEMLGLNPPPVPLSIREELEGTAFTPSFPTVREALRDGMVAAQLAGGLGDTCGIHLGERASANCPYDRYAEPQFYYPWMFGFYVLATDVHLGIIKSLREGLRDAVNRGAVIRYPEVSRQ